MACLQLEAPAPGEGVEARQERVQDDLADLAGAGTGVDLVVLPELWPAGYFAFDRYREVATPLDGPLLGESGALAGLARRLSAVVHAGSVVEAGPGPEHPLHNTSAVFGPDGRRLAVYRKIHVFGYRSAEQELVAPGEEVATFELSGLRAGMATCYDLRFPELFRRLAGDVACYVVPASWPAARADHWTTLLRARAIEDQAYVVGCNAAGTDHGVALAGRSAVVDPWGQVVAEAGEGPCRLDVTVDLDAVAAVRAEMPVLADRRLRDPGAGAGAGAGPSSS